MSGISGNPLLRCLLFATLSQGVFAAGPDQDAPLDEVVVQGTRAQLKQMVQVMVQLEDRFYERYNELNTNDDFDMHCALEARIGTKLKRRYCRPVYEADAIQTEGQEYARFLQRSSAVNDSTPGMPPPPPPPVMGGPPPPAIMAIEARREEYKDNMREVARKHPELVELLRERYEMGQRYEAMRRKAWGLKPPPEDEETAPE